MSWHVFAGSEPPAGTFVQVPRLLDSEHVWQALLHALLQHTPCAQNFDWHSLGSAHCAPLPLRPHEPVVVLQIAGATQSPFAVHVVLHAVVPQANGKQASVAGVTHRPAPSHVDADVDALAAHIAPLHVMPFAYFWHAPAWHRPFVPQVAAPWFLHSPAGSAAPVATFVHFPIVPARPHDWQDPLHALSQQKPCAQNPDWHSFAAEHALPVGFGPHEPFVQTFGATQFAFVEQAVKHAAPLQVNGLQAIVAGATQRPVALHVDAGLKTLAAHDCPAQIVPTLYFAQPPAPSHRPFVPHEAAFMSTHAPRGSTLSAAMSVHFPGADASAQLRQAPAQAVLQQRPSTQFFEAHSPAVAQLWPSAFGPHEPATQTCPFSQSALVTHAAVHVIPLHWNGLQFWTPWGLHSPRPSHTPGVFRRVPEHDA